MSELRSGTTTFSHSGLKHIGAHTDAPSFGSPTLHATRTYDAFGGLQASTGSWQGPFGTARAFGYQTEPSALHLLGLRYYDASSGRFLTRDPLGDGSNWYTYCDNDPIFLVDPEGLFAGTFFRYAVRAARGGFSKLKRLPGGMKDARKVRMRGDDVLVSGPDAKSMAKELEEGIPGKTKHHEAHDGVGGSRPHYQTDGHPGHSFYDPPILVPIIGDIYDLVDVFIEFIDPHVRAVRKGLTRVRVNRWLGPRDEYTTYLE